MDTCWPSATLMRVTTACIGEAMTPDCPSSAAALAATLCRPWPRSGWVGSLAPRARAEPVRLSTMSCGTVSVTRRLSISMTKDSVAVFGVSAAPALSEAGWPALSEPGSRFR